jgi:FtsH-binding integral membrane protein
MNALKWIAFLPLAALLIALAQLVTGMIIQNTPWWFGLPLVFFFGVIVAMAGMLPVKMVSDPKIAATVLITLFVLFEGISLMGVASSLPTKELIGRILVDIQILVGAFIGANQYEKKEIRKEQHNV